jgi:hypothetical protein
MRCLVDLGKKLHRVVVLVVAVMAVVVVVMMQKYRWVKRK